MSIYCYECMTAGLPEGTRKCPACGADVPYVKEGERDCPAGTVLNRRYLLGSAIGRGGFGVTYIALDMKENRRVCIKEYNPKNFSRRDPLQRTNLRPEPEGDADVLQDYERFKRRHLNEGRRLRELARVQGVVRCFDIFEANNTAYLVLEYLQGCDLKRYVLDKSGLTVVQCIDMSIRILSILSVVHEHKMLHRDISPDNIFLCENEIKLIDFGAAANADRGEMTAFNKQGYAAPEMVLGTRQDQRTDIYSAGAVIYFMLTGKKPVKKDDGTLQPPPSGLSTPILSDIFRKATAPNPEERYQYAAQMIADLQYVLNTEIGQTEERNGNKGRGLLIGVLSAVTAGLIGVIVWAGMGSSDAQQDAATPPVRYSHRVDAQPSVATVSVTQSLSPAPTTPALADSPTPESVPTPTGTPADATPPEVSSMPAETPTEAPTPSPTPTRAPVYELTRQPEASYRLYRGEEMNIPLSYGQEGSFDLRLYCNSKKVAVKMNGTEAISVVALEAGQADVQYFDGETERTFQVEVMEIPTAEMRTQATADRDFDGRNHAYTLYLPKGDTVEVNLSDSVRGGLKAEVLAGNAGSVQVAFADVATVRITGVAEGEQCVVLCTGDTGMQLIRLDVIVGPHVVTNELQDTYTLLEGAEITLPLTLSDGQPLTAQDINVFGDGLQCTAAVGAEPGLRVRAEKFGVADMSICGRNIRFLILSRPELAAHEALTAEGGRYAVKLPAGSQVELPLKNSGKEHRYQIRLMNGAPCKGLTVVSGNDRLRVQAADAPASGNYGVYVNDTLAFELQVTTVSANTLTHLPDLTLFVGCEKEIALTYAHALTAETTVDSTKPWVVKAEMTQNGRSLRLIPLKAGEAEVTAAGKTFRVTVCEASLHVATGKNITQHNTGAKVDLMQGTTETLTLLGVSDAYDLTWNNKDSKVAAIKLGKDGKLTVEALAEGTEVFTFRSNGTDDDRELMALWVQVAFDYQLNTVFEANYTFLETDAGQTESFDIPLTFAGNRPYALKVSSENEQVVRAEQSGDLRSLKLIPGKPGETCVNVGEKTFVVKVCEADVEITGVRNLQKKGNEYTLTLTEGDQAAMMVNGLDTDCDLSWTDDKNRIASIKKKGNALVVNADKEGSQTFVFSSNGTKNDRELFTLKVNVAFRQQLTTSFKDKYVVLAGERITLPLTFKRDAVFDIAASSSASDVVQAKQSSDGKSLMLDCRRAGMATITVGDKSFAVQVAESVALAAQNMTVSQGKYQLSVWQGDEVSICLQDEPEGYSVYLRDAQGQEQKLTHATAWTVPTERVGTCNYSLRARNDDFSTTLGSVTVTVKQPTLNTSFRNTYSIVQGQSYTLHLSSDGRMPELKITSDSGVSIHQEDSSLRMTGNEAGSYQVTVDDGASKQVFTVKVAALPTPRLFGDVLPRQANGTYQMELTAGFPAELTLTGAEGFESINWNMDSKLRNAASMNVRASGVTLNAKSDVFGSRITVSGTHKAAGLVSEGSTILAVIDVNITRQWMLSDVKVDLSGHGNMKQTEVMKAVLTALQQLDLWSGSSSTASRKAIEANGGVKAEYWQKMEQARASYGGFSSMPYYTYEDYQHLIDLGEKREAERKAEEERIAAEKAAAEKAEQERLAREQRAQQKDTFVITNAAAVGNTLYLLDADGYLIACNSSGKTISVAYDRAAPYELLAGNGSAMVAVDAMGGICTEGLSSILEEKLRGLQTDISQVALADDSILVVLGSRGRFSLAGDTLLNKENRDRSLTAGQAVYLTNTWDESASAAVLANGYNDKAAPKQVKALAAGGSYTIMLAEYPGWDNPQLYIKGDNNAPLADCLDKYTNFREFARVNKRTSAGKFLGANTADVAISDDVLAAVEKDGTVYMCGMNGSYQMGTGGQLGNKGNSGNYYQVMTAKNTPITNITGVALMDGYTLLLDKQGGLWICGTVKGRTHPYAEKVSGVAGVAKLIRLDENRALAIDRSGRILLIADGSPKGSFTQVTNLPK